MEQKILVGFIGTGRKAKDEPAETYERTTYIFPDGTKFRTSLITSALVNKLDPDKIVLIGTSKSIWSELYLINPEKLEKSSAYYKIFEECYGNENVSEKTLKEWEEFLSKTLGKEFSLNLVSGSATYEIVEVLYREITGNYETLFLDITHAFRHFPLIASFFLPSLYYLKRFKNLYLIYGMFGYGTSEVIFLDLVNDLIKLNEAIALSEHSGNFTGFGDIFPRLKEELFDLYLKVETNRRIGNARWRKLAQKMEEERKDIVGKISGTYISERVVKELMEENLPLRMAKRAIFFAERFQFLKAYTLIFEALINTQPQNVLYEERKKRLESSLNPEDKVIYHTIRKVRNAIAHGDEDISKDIKEILESSEKLKEWVEKGYKLVKKLTSS
ncbi:TIGR02221 family CRISPR-associated protein [Aquifex sp.]